MLNTCNQINDDGRPRAASTSHRNARVDSRATNSGATRRCAAENSRFSCDALIPSTKIPTAVDPIASIGCRIVVSDGVYNDAAATSSNPITEHSSGTRTPAFESARIAPNAVKSSNAMIAVNCFLRFSNSSVKRYPASNPEFGSRDSGRSTINRASSSSAFAAAKLLIPRQRGPLSPSIFGPRINAILRCPSEYRCSSAMRPPTSLSTITELIESVCNSPPIKVVGIVFFSRSAKKLMSRKSQLASTINPSTRRSSSISK